MSFKLGSIIWFQQSHGRSTFAVYSSQNTAIGLCLLQRKIIEIDLTPFDCQLHTEQPENLNLARQRAFKYHSLDGRLFGDSPNHFLGTILDHRAEPKPVFDFLVKALGNGAILNADRKAIMAISTEESARQSLESTEVCPVANESIWASLQKGIRFYS